MTLSAEMCPEALASGLFTAIRKSPQALYKLVWNWEIHFDGKTEQTVTGSHPLTSLGTFHKHVEKVFLGSTRSQRLIRRHVFGLLGWCMPHTVLLLILSCSSHYCRHRVRDQWKSNKTKSPQISVHVKLIPTKSGQQELCWKLTAVSVKWLFVSRLRERWNVVGRASQAIGNDKVLNLNSSFFWGF